MEINLRNNILVLLPQKAIWWPAMGTLIISDLHIGKIMHFRQAGIAMPASAVRHNFDVLHALMQNHDIQRVVFTGDMFHSDVNSEWEMFRVWRNQYANVDMHLVLGNHDKLPQSFAADAHLIVHEKELVMAPFTFTHHPRQTVHNNQYLICGHIHPVVRLTGMGRQQITLPCFYFDKNQAILPSFGYFTGGYEMDIAAAQKVVAIANSRLVEIPVN